MQSITDIDPVKADSIQSVTLEADGPELEVLVERDGRVVSRHVLHAVGVGGSLAYFKGGPGVADPVPRLR